MKKKLLLTLAIAALLVCALAICVSAAPRNYQSYEAELVSGEKITVYQAQDWDKWQGRIWVTDVMYTEAPVDSEGTYATVDWAQIKVLDFTNAWGHVYNSTTGEHELKRGTNGSMHICKTSFTAANAVSLEKVITGVGNKIVGPVFSSMPALVELVADEALAEIGYNAFDGCSKFTTVTFSGANNVSNIGQQAFIRCTALETVDFLSSVTHMGTLVFGSCSSLKTVEWPSGVASLPEATFNGCTALVSVTNLGHVTTMGANVFKNCASLKAIEWPSAVTTIPNSTFEGCTALSMEIPEWITSIGSGAFKNSGLVTVTLPSGLTTLGKAAFYNCKSLTHVYNLENTEVTWMGESFYGCSVLEYVRLPKGLVTFEAGGDGTFRNCTSLTSVGEMPTTLEYIGKCSFAGSALSGVLDFSKCTKLTTFQGSTFSNTKITKVILSPSITDLGDHTFTNCTELEEIIGLEFISVPQLKGNLIEGKNKVTELRLPISATDGLLEVGNLLWDRATASPITVYVASPDVKFDGIYYKTSCKVTIIFCGDDYGTFLANNPTTKEKVGENVFAVGAEYSTENHNLIYGNNICDVYYASAHAMTGNAVMQFRGYFNDVTYEDLCTREGCGLAIVDSARTISAMFMWMGYSYSEFADANGAYSVAQCFKVNKDSVAKYTEATGDTFAFGVLATGNASGEAFEPQLDDEKVWYNQFNTLVHDYFVIKVSGITEALKNKSIVFCAYVIDGGEMLYLDANATKTAVAGVSYNELVK